MKKREALSLSLVFWVMLAVPVHAQGGSMDGYSTGAYGELETDESYLERMSDWLATAGKSKEEKAVIKSQRRAARKLEKAREAIARKTKEIAKKKKKAMRQVRKREEEQVKSE